MEGGLKKRGVEIRVAVVAVIFDQNREDGITDEPIQGQTHVWFPFSL